MSIKKEDMSLLIVALLFTGKIRFMIEFDYK